ncbi:MAG: long-chain fatty acid--CoA ligase [Gammaproteobacteria bacterium SG8_30]|jgi:long-chain acyl-CoA synthetase|nr:MAG: long-chain fatty acid--CoA ligase [Gammaproteobacteria bacterium SG8_30]
MNRHIWLKHYPEGVPAEINPEEYRSLKHMFEESCRKYAAHPAFTSLGRTVSYAEMDELSRRFGAWLQKEAGLAKGDRIAIMMPNLLQYPVAVFGALRAGLTVVNTNPLYTARELEHQLNDSGAKVMLIYEGACATLQEVVGRTPLRKVIVTGIGDMLAFPKGLITNLVVRHVKKMVPAWSLPGAVRFGGVLNKGASLRLDPVDVDPEDVAFLQYTGGTTGVAKGAVLTHRNLVANTIQIVSWGNLGEIDRAVVITALPLYHIFALTSNCLTFVYTGGENVLITNPRDMAAFVAELAKVRFTFITGVNTLFNSLLNTPGFERLDFSGLRVALGGGMAVQAAVSERWRQVTGRDICQGWGLTETSPVATCNRVDELSFTGSIGYPLPSTEISIRDDDGNELPVGQVGEICVRGPQVMRGYWNRPEETDKVMLEGGWLRTGDIGRMDEQGLTYIEDRKKDMILVSGFNVYPNEIEGVVAKMPEVLEVAAVAQDDPRSGEVVALFIVPKDAALTKDQVVAFCKKELTGYKVPRAVYFRDELPKTNVGKILRRELRDELRKKVAA